MSSYAEASRPSDDTAALTPLEQRLLRFAGARRALRAAEGVESRWIREALGRSRPNVEKTVSLRDTEGRAAMPS